MPLTDDELKAADLTIGPDGTLAVVRSDSSQVPAETVSIAVAADGSEVPLALRDGRVLRYDPVTGLCQMAPAIADLIKIGYIPGTKRLLLLTRNGPLREWPGDRPIPTEIGEPFRDAQMLTFDSKGSGVAVMANNQITLLKAATLQPTGTLNVPANLSLCTQLVVNPDRGFVLGCGANRTPLAQTLICSLVTHRSSWPCGSAD
jgi:hypothetical protein